jgi:hypothetical protein
MFGAISPTVKNLLTRSNEWTGINTFKAVNQLLAPTDFIRIETATTALAGVQQSSPAVRWRGFGWKTNGPASQAVDFRSWALPIQGVNNPSAEWKLQYRINEGAWSEGLQYLTNAQDGLAIPKLTVNGLATLSAANSATIDTLSNLELLNPAGTRIHISFKFGSTIKGGISNHDGAQYYYSVGAGSSHWFAVGSTIGAPSQVIQIYGGGIYNYGAIHNGSNVTAGSADTGTTTTLSTYGSFAAKGTLVTASSYNIASETVVYGDASGANICSGTPTACNTYTTEGTCNSHTLVGCTWFSGSSCSEFSGTDFSTCESSHAGCTWDQTSCSSANNTDSSTCEALDDAYGGSCAYDTTSCPAQTTTAACIAIAGCTANEGNSCSVFTDTASCNAQTPCVAVVDGDCNTFSDGGGDGTACATQPECSYDSGTGVCSGYYFTACNGNYFSSCTGDLCTGNYYTGGCSGTYGAACQGTANCSNLTDDGSAACNAEAGCTWTSGATYILPPSSVANRGNTSRIYWIKNIGATGTITVVASAGDTLESAISLTTQYQKVAVHHHTITAPCSTFIIEGTCTPSGCSWTPKSCGSNVDESACNADIGYGCSWNSELSTCEGTYSGPVGSCGGTYVASNVWYKLVT